MFNHSAEPALCCRGVRSRASAQPQFRTAAAAPLQLFRFPSADRSFPPPVLGLLPAPDEDLTVEIRPPRRRS